MVGVERENLLSVSLSLFFLIYMTKIFVAYSTEFTQPWHFPEMICNGKFISK